MAGLHWNGGVTIGFSGALAVVIGSSEGIGQAIATGLARAGATVVAAGRDPAKMEGTLAAIRDAGGTGHAETVDVREPESVAAFAAAVTARHGAPSVLVNSMGGTLISPMQDIKVADWENLVHTQLRGTLLVCQAFAPAMAERGYGKIINLSSIAAARTPRTRGAYSVVKAALNQLTVALANEWGPRGIRVNGIAPSTTRTPRASAQLLREPGREAAILAQTPLGRLADVEDMVGPALFLASPLSDFITGQTLVVDGGILTGR